MGTSESQDVPKQKPKYDHLESVCMPFVRTVHKNQRHQMLQVSLLPAHELFRERGQGFRPGNNRLAV